MRPKRVPAFEIYQREDGDWGVRLRAANGEIVACGEGYRGSSTKARNAAVRIRRAAENAAIRIIRGTVKDVTDQVETLS